MSRRHETPKPVRLAESIFDIVYLSVVFVCAALLLFSSPIVGFRAQFALIVLGLGLGDTCHLVPRILGMWTDHPLGNTASQGIGKMVSSLTMTFFYLGLWFIGISLFAVTDNTLTISVVVLTILRVALCVLPPNRWRSDTATQAWIILRNLPFFIIGIAVMCLYGMKGSGWAVPLQFLWVPILCSFVCYAPVVLVAKKHPRLGMLMLPKSCAYIAVIIMGFSFPGV